MILGSEKIKQRLEQGQIFRDGTADLKYVKEASYALRVAEDGLIIDGEFSRVGKPYPSTYIEIEPGKIAILSTQEELDMPGDLVGRLGIRLNSAAQGLTGLMGIQVDPYYGKELHERLFIRVANLGNDSVKLRPGDPVFNIEFSEVEGAEPPETPKQETWDRFLEIIKDQSNASWTYVSYVENYSKQIQEQAVETINNAKAEIREAFQPLVLFGIFLMAVTILGVSVAAILGVREVPEVQIPGWVTSWGWVVLLVTLSAASIVTVGVGILTAWNLRRRSTPASQSTPSNSAGSPSSASGQ